MRPRLHPLRLRASYGTPYPSPLYRTAPGIIEVRGFRAACDVLCIVDFASSTHLNRPEIEGHTGLCHPGPSFHPNSHHDARDKGQPTHGGNRPEETEEICHNAGEKRACGISQVPPKPIDTDCGSTPRRVRGV